MKKYYPSVLLALLCLAGCGDVGDPRTNLAQLDSLVLPGTAKTETTNTDYRCDGHTVNVQYVNKGANGLALLSVDGKDPLIFSRVIAASGSKYAADRYIWWVMGDKATLFQDWEGGEPTNGIACFRQ